MGLPTGDIAKADAAPFEIFREDYKPLPFTVAKMSMDFCLRDREAALQTVMTLVPNPKCEEKTTSLILDGDEESVTLKENKLDGKVLTERVDYKLTTGVLELLPVPAMGAVVETTVTTVPEDNKQLCGIYKSGSIYWT